MILQILISIKNSKTFVKSLINLLLACKTLKKFVKLFSCTPWGPFIRVLGSIKKWYWNLVLVFFLGRKPIPNFNTLFQYHPVVHILKFRYFHEKFVKVLTIQYFKTFWRKLFDSLHEFRYENINALIWRKNALIVHSVEKWKIYSH